jgi:hypothetical protein
MADREDLAEEDVEDQFPLKLRQTLGQEYLGRVVGVPSEHVFEV